VTQDPGATEWRDAYEAAQRAWPTIALSFEKFVAHGMAQNASEPSAIAHLDELFLTCACGAGNERALAILEERYLIPARGCLQRLDPRPELIDDVMQELRTKLLIGDDPRILRYGGRGPLLAWLRVAATRTAIDLLRADKSVAADSATTGIEELPQADLGPEVQLLREAYRDLFNEALAATMRELSVEDRQLLRRHLVDHLTLEEIARPYRLHPASVARRLAALREEIAESVRRRLAAGHLAEGGSTSLESVAQAIRSEVHLSMAALLASTAPGPSTETAPPPPAIPRLP
jgi:RNA polymerase sigma-70 factor (ECF subfamily)